LCRRRGDTWSNKQNDVGVNCPLFWICVPVCPTSHSGLRNYHKGFLAFLPFKNSCLHSCLLKILAFLIKKLILCSLAFLGNPCMTRYQSFGQSVFVFLSCFFFRYTSVTARFLIARRSEQKLPLELSTRIIRIASTLVICVTWLKYFVFERRVMRIIRVESYSGSFCSDRRAIKNSAVIEIHLKVKHGKNAMTEALTEFFFVVWPNDFWSTLRYHWDVFMWLQIKSGYGVCMCLVFCVVFCVVFWFLFCYVFMCCVVLLCALCYYVLLCCLVCHEVSCTGTGLKFIVLSR